jgi:calcium-binding protein CML
MKLSVSSFISNLTSKKHKSKKSRSISRLDARSFDSTTSSSSDESISCQLQSTPKSVLRSSFSDVKISRHELETVLRRLCTDPPTDEEVSAIVAAGGIDGCITMADLGKICESDGEEELREAFDVFDANGDGKISAEELLEVFLAMGDVCTIEDCKRMIGGVDSDGDGLVCFRDFLKMMKLQR